jgi:hypothetical protein
MGGSFCFQGLDQVAKVRCTSAPGPRPGTGAEGRGAPDRLALSIEGWYNFIG